MSSFLLNIFPAHIDKTLIQSMPVAYFEGEVILVDHPDKVAPAVEYLSQHAILGVDTEARPSFKRGVHYPTALVQVSTLERCYLFRLTHVGMPQELADIFANPTYIPEDMQADYDTYWTDERINRVLDVMQKHQIALEINPRYKIPSMKIIHMAKHRGLKFTFGTNNVDADFGKLEYCIEAIRQCGITAQDIWFPSMSVRRTRPVVIYNTFK